MRSLLCAFGIAGIAAAAQNDRAPRPSFLVVVTDDQRADALGCAGHPFLETPNMDALAQHGVRFRNAFATTPICAASRASILTSRYELEHGYTFGTPPLARELTDDSWPRILRDQGWRTGFVGKWGVNAAGAQAELFDSFHSLSPPYWRTDESGTRTHLTDRTGDAAIAFLHDVPAEEPFALYVSFNAPHAEDANPEQYLWSAAEDGLYDDVPIPQPPLATTADFEALPALLRESLGRERWYWRFDDEQKRVRMTRGYYRMITGVDRVLGRLLETLRELDRADETIVVLTSDNGYFLGERGLAGKWLIYEDSTRVPLIVFDPREEPQADARVRDEAVLLLDLGSTILDLAGLDVPGTYSGESLAPLTRGATPEWRTDFLVEHHFDHPKIPKYHGVRGERWVYVDYYEQDPPLEMLFDLRGDPLQVTDLARDPEHEETLARMRERCQELVGRR